MAHPKYKLTYFNVRARAEPIRMIFAYAKVPYEDYRIVREDWPNIKNSFPWDQVPVLEVDGKVLAQSLTITRYLARKYKLEGESDIEAAKCDEYVDAINDLRVEWKKAHFEPDPVKKEALKKEFVDTHCARYFTKFEALAEENAGSDFLVGKKLTWADIVFAHTFEFFEDTIAPGLLGKYPRMKKLREAVYADFRPEIKDWIARRPETPM